MSCAVRVNTLVQLYAYTCIIHVYAQVYLHGNSPAIPKSENTVNSAKIDAL